VVSVHEPVVTEVGAVDWAHAVATVHVPTMLPPQAATLPQLSPPEPPDPLELLHPKNVTPIAIKMLETFMKILPRPGSIAHSSARKDRIRSTARLAQAKATTGRREVRGLFLSEGAGARTRVREGMLTLRRLLREVDR
jgi:hypothetical protein